MDDREIIHKAINNVIGETVGYFEDEVGVLLDIENDTLFSLHTYFRKQLLEKLGEKKKCHKAPILACYECHNMEGYNQLHDHITSIINEVLSVGEKINKQTFGGEQ